MTICRAVVKPRATSAIQTVRDSQAVIQEGAVGSEIGVAVIVGEAGQVQRHGDFYEEIAATVVLVMATIVVMVMVAMLVSMRHRCWSASFSKSVQRDSGKAARGSAAGAVTAFVVVVAIAALFHGAGKDVDHATIFSRGIATELRITDIRRAVKHLQRAAGLRRRVAVEAAIADANRAESRTNGAAIPCHIAAKFAVDDDDLAIPAIQHAAIGFSHIICELAAYQFQPAATVDQDGAAALAPAGDAIDECEADLIVRQPRCKMDVLQDERAAHVNIKDAELLVSADAIAGAINGDVGEDARQFSLPG